MGVQGVAVGVLCLWSRAWMFGVLIQGVAQGTYLEGFCVLQVPFLAGRTQHRGLRMLGIQVARSYGKAQALLVFFKCFSCASSKRFGMGAGVG